jgi:acyl-CoA hydrolase
MNTFASPFATVIPERFELRYLEGNHSLLTDVAMTSCVFYNDPMSKISSDGKPPIQSAVIMTEIVLPSDTNAIGTIFGGKIMSWIDIAGAIAAGRHARRVVVTASIDALHFLAPVKVGHVVHIRAMVNFTSRTSMEVGVRVDSENPITGEETHTATAYTTFVALDDHGRPTPVPRLLPESPQEKRRFEEAKKRRESRVRLAEELKKGEHLLTSGNS